MNRVKEYVERCVKSKRFGMFVAAILLVLVTFGTAVAVDIPIAPQLARRAPMIDGVISAGEWNGSVVTYLPSATTGEFAVLQTMNNARYLFILLDAVNDTGEDPRGDDYFVLAFDADLNLQLTPNVDLFYSSCQDGREFVKAYYLGGTSATGCRTPDRGSAGRFGFGPTPNSATPHRFYEFRLLLSEIGVDPSRWVRTLTGLPGVRLNVTIRSSTPNIDYSYPTHYPWPDMTGSMFRIELAPLTSLPRTADIFAGVGLIPAVPYIDSQGYANINTSYFRAVDSPFGGSLSIFGNWINLRAFGAASYSIHAVRREGGVDANLLQTWTNYRYNFTTFEWDPVGIGPDSQGRYAVPPAGESWYYLNLLINWQSASPLFPDGTYDLNIELFDAMGNPISVPPGVKNSLTLFLANTPPQVRINQVLYDDAPVSACQIVTQGSEPSSGFNFDISVTDANGALDSLALVGIYGNNLSSTVYTDKYVPGHVDGDGPNRWNGIPALTVPPGDARWRAPATCAYSFILSAVSRVQNGYGRVFPYVDTHVSLTIQTGSPVAATGGVQPCESCRKALSATDAECKPSGR